MATAKARKTPAKSADLEPDPPGSSGPSAEFGVETTGRMIVTFVDTSKSGVTSALAAMKNQAGVASVSMASDFSQEYSMAEAESGDAHVFDALGIAVLTGDPGQMTAMASFTPSAAENVIVEPEYVNYAFDEDLDDDLPAGGVGDDASADPGAGPEEGSGSGLGGGSQAYLRGYRDAVNHLAKALASGDPDAVAEAAEMEAAAAAFFDTTSSTWGLKATGALRAQTTGKGIKVAVLDTGFDLLHPDFAGRTVQTNSFILGETVQDGNGHGTHCIGTSCGPVRPGVGARYGVASDAEIFAGKVLSNAGSGGDANILAGINWAVQNGCEVVSMSLGRRVRPGEAPQTNYQTAGRRALAAGTLIVAAAGNDSARPNVTIPVSSPANAGSIAAVAAVDSRLRVARFSNRGINPSGGEINFAGPGVDVLSSWPMPLRLRSISGTSMATPHVAGIAALVAEESKRFRGLELYREMRRRARRLPLPRADVGNGLIRI
jgi:subtilisin family serine protease